MLTKKTKTPLVSVIMPAHNADGFLKEAIKSILNQSFKDFELIIINDGSLDKTVKIARSFVKKDPRVKLISYRKNKGESVAANLGCAKSNGKYIARMDADDIAHRDRLAKQVAFLNSHLQYIVVGSQAHIIDEKNQIIGQKTFPCSHQDIYNYYGILHPMLHPSIMVRRSVLPDPKKLWANQAEPNDDYFTLFELLQYGKFANLSQKLISYRMHRDNKSMQNIKKKFLNSLKIRILAVRKFNYPLSLSMIIQAIIQAVVVLTLPEWVTVGLFMWLKGIKSFDLAFPIVGKVRQEIINVTKINPNWSVFLPTLLAVFIHTLIFKVLTNKQA